MTKIPGTPANRSGFKPSHVVAVVLIIVSAIVLVMLRPSATGKEARPAAKATPAPAMPTWQQPDYPAYATVNPDACGTTAGYVTVRPAIYNTTSHITASGRAGCLESNIFLMVAYETVSTKSLTDGPMPEPYYLVRPEAVDLGEKGYFSIQLDLTPAEAQQHTILSARIFKVSGEYIDSLSRPSSALLTMKAVPNHWRPTPAGFSIVDRPVEALDNLKACLEVDGALLDIDDRKLPEDGLAMIKGDIACLQPGFEVFAFYYVYNPATTSDEGPGGKYYSLDTSSVGIYPSGTFVFVGELPKKVVPAGYRAAVQFIAAKPGGDIRPMLAREAPQFTVFPTYLPAGMYLVRSTDVTQ